MSDDPAVLPPIETIPSVDGEVSALASASAPFIYFDRVASFGFEGGIAHVTLEALRYVQVGEEARSDRVIVAHIRMGLGAAANLYEALGGALLLAEPVEEGAAH